MICLLSLFVVTQGITPEQIHIQYGDSAMSRVVSWLTLEPLPLGIESTVWYGLTATLNLTQKGTSIAWVTGVNNRTTSYVLLDGLPTGSTIFYQVGFQFSNGTVVSNKSDIFQMEISDPWALPFSFVSFGDFSTIKANPSYSLDSVPLIANLTNRGARFVIHEGDMAYTLQDLSGSRGDNFLNSLQNITTKVPYMTCPGNHELDVNNDFLNYHRRYAGLATITNSSGSPSLHYYSWDYGPIHFATIDTDAVIYGRDIQWLKDMSQPQFNWLKTDLKKVNRTKTPWVLVYYHHSMYCTSKDANADIIDPLECGFEPGEIRGHVGSQGLEELFLNTGVDLILVGHSHHYERTYPVYDDIKIQSNYKDPKAPIHLISGYPMAGGGFDPFATPKILPSWVAFRDLSLTPGVNQITIHNSSHLHIQFFRADNFAVLDDVWLVQNRHGPFPYPTEQEIEKWVIIASIIGGIVALIIVSTVGCYLCSTNRCCKCCKCCNCQKEVTNKPITSSNQEIAMS